MVDSSDEEGNGGLASAAPCSSSAPRCEAGSWGFSQDSCAGDRRGGVGVTPHICSVFRCTFDGKRGLERLACASSLCL